MKTKILGLSILVAATATLSACGSIPQCHEELDNCSRNSAYTEERTAKATPKMAVVEVPEAMPIAKPVAAPKPAPVKKAAPKPAPIVDTQVMKSAEPMVQHISK